MNKLHTAMVNTCDRLLLLLTGPQAARDPVVTNTALQAIELLQLLEGRLKGTADNEDIDPTGFSHLLHSAEVSNHMAEVLGVLHEQGLCPPEATVIRH